RRRALAAQRPMTDFTGKVALVTGAASGIGRASALAFARRGATVVAAAVDVAGGEQTAELARESGGDALFIPSDVTAADQVCALIEKTVEHYGRLDCAHNNAGLLGTPMDLAQCSEAVWDRIVSVNLRGVWLCMKHEIPPMLENYTQKNPEVEAQLLLFQPLGRMGTPDEVAAAVVWLCSDEAAFVTGSAMTLDGAWTAQ